MQDLQRKTVAEFHAAGKMPIVVILENIRSAYNVGSIFRTCDAFLIEAVYLTGYTATPPHKEIKKTALGADESVQWSHFPDAKSAIASAKNKQYRVYAVEQTTNSMKLQDLPVTPNDHIALVFGNEVSGVEMETILSCDGCVEIPQLGMKHSINVATAAGIVLWELVRDRITSPQKL